MNSKEIFDSVYESTVGHWGTEKDDLVCTWTWPLSKRRIGGCPAVQTVKRIKEIERTN